eukprot:GEMP01019322.1.p1 GENE.GEMP01019322.1~~GEMP01019322.1.p1  ORF type:complete len:523 (+),score=143.62 GEMP01019322.1:51-1619(+)
MATWLGQAPRRLFVESPTPTRANYPSDVKSDDQLFPVARRRRRRNSNSPLEEPPLFHDSDERPTELLRHMAESRRQAEEATSSDQPPRRVDDSSARPPNGDSSALSAGDASFQSPQPRSRRSSHSTAFHTPLSRNTRSRTSLPSDSTHDIRRTHSSRRASYGSTEDPERAQPSDAARGSRAAPSRDDSTRAGVHSPAPRASSRQSKRGDVKTPQSAEGGERLQTRTASPRGHTDTTRTVKTRTPKRSPMRNMDVQAAQAGRRSRKMLDVTSAAEALDPQDAGAPGLSDDVQQLRDAQKMHSPRERDDSDKVPALRAPREAAARKLADARAGAGVDGGALRGKRVADAEGEKSLGKRKKLPPAPVFSRDADSARGQEARRQQPPPPPPPPRQAQPRKLSMSEDGHEGDANRGGGNDGGGGPDDDQIFAMKRRRKRTQVPGPRIHLSVDHIPRAVWRRIARKAGIERMRKDTFHDLYSCADYFLENILVNVNMLMWAKKKNVITSKDIMYVLDDIHQFKTGEFY